MTQENDELEEDNSFINALLNEDILGCLIRAQIHIEEKLNEYIKLKTHNEKALRLLKLDYEQTCQLAICLGLRPELLKPLKNLGKIRNKFAHELNYDLNKMTINNYYKCFSSNDKEIINSTYEKVKKQIGLDSKDKLSNQSISIKFSCYTSALRAALIAEI